MTTSAGRRGVIVTRPWCHHYSEVVTTIGELGSIIWLLPPPSFSLVCVIIHVAQAPKNVVYSIYL